MSLRRRIAEAGYDAETASRTAGAAQRQACAAGLDAYTARAKALIADAEAKVARKEVASLAARLVALEQHLGVEWVEQPATAGYQKKGTRK